LQASFRLLANQTQCAPHQQYQDYRQPNQRSDFFFGQHATTPQPSRRAPAGYALFGRRNRIRTEYGANQHACQQSEKYHHDNQQPEVLSSHIRIMRPPPKPGAHFAGRS
jgi:hypothetical protein